MFIEYSYCSRNMEGWFDVLNFGRQQTSVFLILIAIIIILSAMLFKKDSDNPSLELVGERPETHKIDELFETDDRPDTEKTSNTIKVYITGQVRHPGVIEIEEGSRLIDAIELAGGMLDEADKDRINLALKVQDEGMYIIPKIGEEIEEGFIQNGDTTSADNTKVNINKASAEELQTLHGIGPAKAKAIIDYRENQGLFKDIEDIKKVSGIGEKTFEQIQDSITVK